MDLETVADELYGLRPDDFTSARDARAAEARAAGDRTLAGKIGKLRRPSLSAWASNLLVREQPEETESLLRLGEGLRQAHRDLDGSQLRDLSRQQHVVINELSRQARRLADQAGHPISDSAQHEVETILHAVLADTGAAEEWATGRLVKAFDGVAGFPAASEGARPRPAKPTPRPAKATPRRESRRDAARAKADQEHRRRLEKARQEAEAAERDLKAREDEAAQADRQADDAQSQADTLQQRVSELTEELRRLEKEQQQAETAVRKARDEARSADRGVREARRRAKTATERVRRLTAEEPRG
jgi:DNA repair exonuclease SbcCD ATPase subunit